MHMDERRFSLGQIAKALNAPASTIRAWFRLGYFGLREDDRKRAAEGLAHAVSLRTALWVGAVLELTKYGMSAERAAKVARGFVILGEVDQATGKTLREPGGLYQGHGVFTALVAHPGSDDGVVIRFDSEIPMANVFWNGQLGKQTSAVIVWLNFIDQQVRLNLPGGAD